MKKIFLSVLIFWLHPDLFGNELLDVKYQQQADNQQLVFLFRDKPDYQTQWQKNIFQLTISSLDKIDIKRTLIQKVDSKAGRFKLSQHQLLFESNKIIKKQSQISLQQEKKSGNYKIKIQWFSLSKMSPEKLWSQAKISLASGLYDEAIRLMIKIRSSGKLELRMLSQEFLGVARERKGQLAFARDEYQRYLKEYPESKNSSRVKQRLAALIGIETLDKNRKLKKRRSRSKRNTNGWSSYGSVSSDYRYSSTIDNGGNMTTSLSLINADMDVTGRYRNEDYELQARFSGGEYQDLRSGGQASSERLRYFYLNGETADRIFKARLGRQRSSNGGVFGRFDGLLASGKIIDDLSLNLVAGYPVDSSRNTSVDTSRKFYGLNMDINDIWDKLDTNLFVIEQKIGPLLDRRAVGGDIRYLDEFQSIYAMVDYDVHFNALNAFLLNGNHRLENKTRINWSVNIRKSPYLSTRNALIGQPVDSIQELQQLFITDAEILDLALDRTLESRSASVQVSMPYNETVDLSSSLTWLQLSDSPASGGVPGFASSGGQYYFNLQVTGRKVLTDFDTSYLGLRISSLKQSSIYSIYANSRIPWKEHFTINPKIRFDYRDNKDGSSQFNISPSFRFQYQEKQHIVYAETGAIYFLNQIPSFSSQNTTILYLYLGYRYSFY